MKPLKIIAVLTLAFLFVAQVNAKAPSYCKYYPHWQDCATNGKLVKLEKFIKKYAPNAKNYIAAFDWDGTLYNEHIPVRVNGQILKRSGQSVWHNWAAEKILHNHSVYNYLLPSFKRYSTTNANQIDYQAWHDAIVDQDGYLEGEYKELKVGPHGKYLSQKLPQGVYDKFSQTGSFETGMTFSSLRKGLHYYLQDYPTKKYAFLKTLDIVHRLGDLGFRVWLITGANPYFIANLITDPSNGINHTPEVGYTILPNCQKFMDNKNVGNKTPDQLFQACPIAGNGALWSGGNRPFTREYDNRNFVGVLPAGIKMAVDGYGKWYAAQHIAKSENKKIILYAGNSNGDNSIMKKILANKFAASKGTFGIFVQPKAKSDFAKLMTSACSSGQCMDIEEPN